MTDDLTRLESKLDELLKALPMLYALGAILVPRHVVNQRVGLNKNTLEQNRDVTKYKVEKSNRTYVEVGEISAIVKRKAKRNMKSNSK